MGLTTSDDANSYELNLSGALDARHHQGDWVSLYGVLCQRCGTAHLPKVKRPANLAGRRSNKLRELVPAEVPTNIYIVVKSAVIERDAEWYARLDLIDNPAFNVLTGFNVLKQKLWLP